MTNKKATPDARVTTFVSKADSAGGLPVYSNAGLIEDEYREFYQMDGHGGLIEPPYSMKRLEELVMTNNTLGPCIEAMVNNIDGTGYEIERRDGKKMEEADVKKVEPAKEFFGECLPMVSFDTLRKKMRRELESTGMGYMELMRNVAGELIFLGPIEAKMIRIAKLDSAVPVEVKMMRGGKEVSFTRMKRERRFAQKVGEKLIWFKEYGASRELNKYHGTWETTANPVSPTDRATELLMFGVDPDISSPYCLPRWIAQTPSVLASRKAEEHNLEFFDSGGIPPYLVIVQGGQLAEKTVDAVRDALNQKGAHARIQVIEAFSTSGDLNASSNVQVKVERFGGERTDDAMFGKFDLACEASVRKAFRLPPLLIGKSDDLNFASAEASYLVAEAQVFKPEREEFDEVISSSLLVELLGSRDYVFRSKPISIVDAQTKLNAIEKAVSINRVDAEHTITLIGETAGVEFKMAEGDELTIPNPPPQMPVDPTGNVIPISSARKPAPQQKQQIQKDDTGLSDLLSCTLAVIAAQEPVE